MHASHVLTSGASDSCTRLLTCVVCPCKKRVSNSLWVRSILRSAVHHHEKRTKTFFGLHKNLSTPMQDRSAHTCPSCSHHLSWGSVPTFNRVRISIVNDIWWRHGLALSKLITYKVCGEYNQLFALQKWVSCAHGKTCHPVLLKKQHVQHAQKHIWRQPDLCLSTSFPF